MEKKALKETELDSFAFIKRMLAVGLVMSVSYFFVIEIPLLIRETDRISDSLKQKYLGTYFCIVIVIIFIMIGIAFYLIYTDTQNELSTENIEVYFATKDFEAENNVSRMLISNKSEEPMKQIEMKEFRLGWGTEQSQVVDPINQRIKELSAEGTTNIQISVTPTGKGVMVTLIYEIGIAKN